MVPKKRKKQVNKSKEKRLEDLGIYADEDENEEKEIDEKELWRDVG